MRYLNEKIRDFYRNQTFYKAARDFEPELKKIIVQFLRKKGVTKLEGRYDGDVDYDNLPTDPKKKENLFKKATSNTSVNRGFFSAKDAGYGDDVEIVPFTYKGLKIVVSIITNTEFFIDGHDLKVSIKDGNSSRYDGGTKYYYKINLMSKIENVLEKVWDKVEESLAKYDKGIKGAELEKPKNKIDRIRGSNAPDIKRLVKIYLQQWTKKRTLKSGEIKKTKYTDTDKLPIEFYVSMGSTSPSDLSSEPRGKPSFTINYKLKTKRFKLEKVLQQYPKLREWHEAWMNAVSKNGRRPYIGRFGRQFESYKLIDSSHYEMFNKLEYVIGKMSIHGYKPTTIRGSFRKRGEPNSIYFEYFSELEELAKKNPKQARKQALEDFNKDRNKDFKDSFFDNTINMDNPHFFHKYYLDRIFR